MIQTGDLSLYEGIPFGNIMFRSDYSELIQTGFRPGDSVSVQFSNGAVLEDIPFLSSCILPEGTVCVNAHEGFDWVRVEKRFGRIWETCGLTGNETGKIVLNEPQKYALLFQAFNTEFSLNRDDYPKDEFYANYRELSGGNIRKGSFYRSAASFDPLNDTAEFRERQKCLDRLMERDGIQFVISMTADSRQMKELFDSGACDDSYIGKLYREGKVFSELFPSDFSGTEFRKQLASALRSILSSKGPYLIQCRAGLDRTGFVCSLLGALAGAEADEIREEYMRSYEYLFGLDKEKDRGKYSILQKDQAERILDIIAQNEPENAKALSAAAEKYLEQCGITEKEMNRLKVLLTGEPVPGKATVWTKERS